MEKPLVDGQMIYDMMDTLYQARLARLTAGISPAGLRGDFFSWLNHLAMAPGRLAQLAQFPSQKMPEMMMKLMNSQSLNCANDPRFKGAGWCEWPWRGYVENFLLAEQWWHLATHDVPGLPVHAERVVSFVARQFLDMLCPSNFPLTSPEIFNKTIETHGTNLVHGAFRAADDMRTALFDGKSATDAAYQVGKNLAVTKGKVVFKNDLMELIQYSPTTETVYKEPILIMPAWIMKYYILDLSPENSLVKWLVAQGHTVFIMSWKNPTSEDRDRGMDDYFTHGAMAAVTAVSEIVGGEKIHLAGYCLGGTLAMLTASAMAREKDKRLASLTLFAAQGDFSEAGELMLFISESEIEFIKNMMWAKGYLDTKQMAGAFQMLRSYDLIWSRLVHAYFLGEPPQTNDMMVWNADATRMPYRMHTEYLEKLFLRNELASGRYKLCGKPVALENISVPVFAVGTETDHVAPWRSVHKIHLMVNSDVTFALTSGGHNAGIVSEPGHPHRHFALLTRQAGEAYLDPDAWQAAAERHEGSWWLAWQEWLVARSSSEKCPARTTLGSESYKPHADAPGIYIYQT